ncbi:MAG: hypothetical protein SOY99_05715 [Alloprevotella sp.]|nr:hypothetical protein [Bacteroidales bacterium]MDY3943707.1 hypothetical protein [Alloprevotella sp.]
MAKIENSYFGTALIVGCVIGFLLSFFNVCSMNDNIWIPVSVIAIGGFIGVFVGKILELEWIDLGLPIGLLVGLGVGYFFA